MLKLNLPAIEFYDERTNQFFDKPAVVVRLEHSLASLSKWEQAHKKAFLGPAPKTFEESLDYVVCMSLDDSFTEQDYYRLSSKQLEEIQAYITEQRTATTIKRTKSGPSREIITAELIYYWMVALTIPFEAENWHLSKLLTLIEVCAVKNQPKKKVSRSEMLAQQRSLNAQRRAAMNTTG